MRVSKRIVTFFLALAMLFSVFTVAGAAEPASGFGFVLVDIKSKTAIDAYLYFW